MTDSLDPDIRRAAHQAASLPLAEGFRTSPAELIDRALDAVVPAIRAAEQDRLLPLLRAADSHITYLSNLVSDHTDLRDWDDGPDLEAAITELGGGDRG